MKYLKSFKNHDRYHSFLDSDEFVKPNVSFIESDESMRYHRFKGPFIPPTPPEEEDTEPMIRATFMASEANMLGLGNTANIKKLKVDGEEVPIEYVDYIYKNYTLTSMDVSIPSDGDTSAMCLSSNTLSQMMSEIGVENLGDLVGVNVTASHAPNQTPNALILFFDGKIKSDENGTHQEEPISLASPLNAPSIMNGMINVGDGGFFNYDDTTHTANINYFMITIMFMLYTGAFEGACFAYVDYNTEEVELIDTNMQLKISQSLPPYCFNTTGKHVMEIILGDNSVPALMFAGSNATEIKSNKFVNDFYAESIVGAFQLNTIHSDGLISLYEMGCSGNANLKQWNAKQGIKTIGSMAFMETPIYDINLSKCESISMEALSSSIFLDGSIQLDNIEILSPQAFGGIISGDEVVSHITSVRLGDKCTYVCGSALTPTIAYIECTRLNEPYLMNDGVFNNLDKNIVLSLPNSAEYNDEDHWFKHAYSNWLNAHPFIVETPYLKIPDNLTFDGYDVVAVYQSSIESTILCNSITNVSEIKIENEVLSEVVSAYTFDESHEYYVVRYKLTDGVIPANFFKNTRLVKIIFGENIISIGDNALLNCYGLKELNIPDNVQTLGKNLIPSTNLTSVTIGSGVTSMQESTLQMGFWLKSINVSPNNPIYEVRNNCLIDKTTKTVYAAGDNASIPNDIVAIAPLAFSYGRVKENGDILPSTLTSIGEMAFYHCTGLKNISIPDSVTFIGSSAFTKCRDLENVVIGNGITDLSNSLFSYSTSLKSVSLPSTINKISPYSFAGCMSLTGITIPSTVLEIGASGFSYNNLLEHLTIKEGCTTIGNCAFLSNRYLRKLSIPSTVTSIGVSAFTNCSLSEIIVAPENTVYESEGHALVVKATKKMILGTMSFIVPDGVVTIGSGSFPESNSDLFAVTVAKDEITIPASVTLIEEGAFGQTVKTIRCLGKTAPTLKISSSDLTDKGTVYYPYGSTGYDTWQSNLKDWTFIQVNE